MTVDDQIIYGFYENNQSTYYIEPLWYFIQDAPQDLFVVYDEKDVKKVEGKTCGAIESHDLAEDWIDDEVMQEAQRSMGCYIVNVRLAADWSMNQKYFGAAGATGKVIGVLNNVASNYDDEFNHQLILVAGSAWVSSCSTCDPWTTSTDAGTLLGSFTGWGNGGGFGTTNYAVAGLWTNRNLAGSTVGIAWLSAICNNSRYHVCQDFTSNANSLRVLQAHELGHNFGSGHDASGAPFIMAPAVNGSNTWSGQSQNAINGLVQNRINQGGCFTSCGPPVLPPVANFSSTHINPICPGESVQFVDQSANNPSSYSWSFPGGTPATSTNPNPVVSYSTPGFYSVTLTVTNSAGSNTLTLPAFVAVENDPIAVFTSNVNLNVVQFLNQSLYANNYFWDFGDGTTSTQRDPQHVYVNDGVYFVTLEVSNSCGTDEITSVVTIVTPPTAGFRMDNSAGCVPLTVQFENLSTRNVSGFEWKFPGGTPNVSFSINPEIEYQTAGTYDVTLIAYNSQYRDTFVFTDAVTVGETVDAFFTDTTNIDTAFFFSGAVGWDSLFWDFGDGTTSDTIIENPVHIYGQDGDYNVMQVTFNDCGTDTLIKRINISTIPVASFEADVTSGCVSFDANFTNLSSVNADTFYWSFPGGLPATSSDENPTVTYDATGLYSVSLIVANANGRDTITLDDYIMVSDVPTSAFTSSIANFTEVSFSNNSVGGTSFAWDFGDGNTSTLSDPTHTYATDGTYTVTLETSNLCGTTTTTESVVIVTLPTAEFSVSNNDGCAPFSVDFTDLSSSNVTSWSWSFTGGNPATSNDQNPTVVFNNAGTYDVVLTVSNSAGNDIQTKTGLITVGTEPVAQFTSNVNLAQVSFTNASNGAIDYSWDFGDGNSSTEVNPVHTYAQDGTYTVTLTTTNACGTNVTTETITIVTPPSAGFMPNGTSGCAPYTVSYANSSSSNAVSFNWTFEGGNPMTSTDENPVVEYNSPGSYDVTLIVTNTAGSDTVSFTEYINVSTTPTADFGTTINMSSVDFSNSSTGADSYSWDFGDGQTSTDENPSHTYAMDGTYTVTLTTENGCGTNTSTQNVEIVTPPTAGFGAGSTVGCEPFMVTFNNQSSANAATYQWSFPGGNPTTSTDENPVVEYAAAGTYTVELIASNAQFSDTVTFTNYITVNPIPTTNFTSMVDLANVDFTNLSANADSYVWDFGDGNTSTDPNPSHTYGMDGVYTVTLTATNDCGTTTYTQNIAIATAAPVALFDVNSQTGCAPFTVQFNNQSSANATSYQWSFPGGNPSSSTEENPVVVYDNPGTYDVSLTATNTVGDNTYSQSSFITVGSAPSASFDFNLTDASASFNNNSTGGTSYTWDFGDGTTSNMQDPGVHVFPGNGDYTVTLTVENACGTETFSQVISINGSVSAAGFDTDVRRFCAPGTVNFTGCFNWQPYCMEMDFPWWKSSYINGSKSFGYL
ncbi:MAG: PKD domain-containing protein [Saprospiraceae bacterium]